VLACAICETAPARLALFLVGERFPLRRIKLAAVSLTFFQRAREYLPIETAPPFWRAFFLMRLRFLLGSVALPAFRQAIRPRGLKNFSVNAAPPTRLAISDRIFFFRKPLTAFLSAFHVGHLNYIPVEAAPAILWSAIFLRFGERLVTLDAFCLALSPCSLNYFFVNAAPVRPAVFDCFF
jgi:hypothetical protein